MSDDVPDGQLVYDNTVDEGTWRVKVMRTGPYQGQLTVTKIDDATVILDEQVGLAYDAMFGPDVSDVSEWQQKSIEAIDTYSESNTGP